MLQPEREPGVVNQVPIRENLKKVVEYFGK